MAVLNQTLKTITAVLADGPVRIGPLTIMDCTCIAIVAGCIETIGVRLHGIMEALRAAKKGRES